MLQDTNQTDSGDGQILHPGSRQLFRHWEKLRAERPCPTREEFDLGPLKSVLPELVVIDRDFLRSSFKYRLAGTQVCALFNRELTGQNPFDGWDSFEIEVMSKHLLTVINQMQPVVIRMRLTTDKGQTVAAELLAVPVQMRGTHRIQIVGGLFPFRSAKILGHKAIMKRELVSARVIWTEHQEPLRREEPVDVSPPIRGVMRNFRLIDGGRA